MPLTPPSGRSQDPKDPGTLARLNAERLKAVTPNASPPAQQPRQRRTITTLVALLIIDAPLIDFAWKSGPGDPFLFVPCVSAASIVSAVIIWNTWGLNTR